MKARLTVEITIDTEHPRLREELHNMMSVAMVQIDRGLKENLPRAGSFLGNDAEANWRMMRAIL